MWVVLLQSSFEFNIRIGANSQQFWHYSCLCPCQQNSLVLLWPFLCRVSANMPLQGTREILCLHERFCFTFAWPVCMEFFSPSSLGGKNSILLFLSLQLSLLKSILQCYIEECYINLNAIVLSQSIVCLASQARLYSRQEQGNYMRIQC